MYLILYKLFGQTLLTTYNKNAAIKKNIVKLTKFCGISFFPRMSLANTIHNILKNKIIMYSPTCIKSNIIINHSQENVNS